MEVIKNISSVIGLIASAIGLATLFSEKMKQGIANLFKKYNQEQNSDIKELKELVKGINEKLSNHIIQYNQTVEKLIESDEIVLEFTRQQCRNIIKDIFYKYYDSKMLPVYEKKTLMAVKKIYIENLNGNSYAKGLIDEMEKWEVDYKSTRVEEE